MALNPAVSRMIAHGLANPAEIGVDPAQDYLWEHQDVRGLNAVDGGPAVQAAIERGMNPSGYADLRDPAAMADYRALFAGALILADNLSKRPAEVKTTAGADGVEAVSVTSRRPEQYATQERAISAGIALRPFGLIGERARVLAKNAGIPVPNVRQFFTSGGLPARIAPYPGMPGGGGLVGLGPAVAAILVVGGIAVAVVGAYTISHVLETENANDNATKEQIAIGNALILSREAITLRTLFEHEAQRPGEPLDDAEKAVLQEQDVAVSKFVTQMPKIVHPDPLPAVPGTGPGFSLGRTVLYVGGAYVAYKLISKALSGSGSSPVQHHPPTTAPSGE